MAANFVYVASDRALPLAAIMAAQAKRSAPLVAIDEPAKIDRFQGKAIVLTDNFAPVDQLFTP